MNTTAEKLSLLLETKAAIKAALIEKGQTVPDDLPFSAYADKVRAIESGGGGTTLGDLPEGSIIFLNESGKPTPFYVAKQNYEPELNGQGRTLVVRRNGLKLDAFSEENHCYSFSESTSCLYLNGAYKSSFDSGIIGSMSVTNFYTQSINEDNDEFVDVQSESIFLLPKDLVEDVSSSRLGILPELLYLRDEDDVLYSQWTSSLRTRGRAYCINKNGAIQDYPVNTGYAIWYRPCFTLPADYIPY